MSTSNYSRLFSHARKMAESVRAIDDRTERDRAIDKLVRRLDGIEEKVTKRAAEIGAKGGQTTAERMKAKDPDYYKRIAAMRKTRAGGRPSKHSE